MSRRPRIDRWVADFGEHVRGWQHRARPDSAASCRECGMPSARHTAQDRIGQPEHELRRGCSGAPVPSACSSRSRCGRSAGQRHRQAAREQAREEARAIDDRRRPREDAVHPPGRPGLFAGVRARSARLLYDYGLPRDDGMNMTALLLVSARRRRRSDPLPSPTVPPIEGPQTSSRRRTDPRREEGRAAPVGRPRLPPGRRERHTPGALRSDCPAAMSSGRALERALAHLAARAPACER